MDRLALLYDKHIDALFEFGSRLLPDKEALKDCIQDVFVKLFTRKNTLDSIKNIDHYLYISLRNRINDEYRRNVKLCDNEISDSSMQVLAENEAYTRERMEQRQLLSDTMEKFFEKLSPRQRQIIHLYYNEHLKYEDICQVMGINYQSVRNLMHRSITRLRECANNTQIAL